MESNDNTLGRVQFIGWIVCIVVAIILALIGFILFIFGLEEGVAVDSAVLALTVAAVLLWISILKIKRILKYKDNDTLEADINIIKNDVTEVIGEKSLETDISVIKNDITEMTEAKSLISEPSNTVPNDEPKESEQDLYLNSFDGIETYDLKKKLDSEFMKKLKRSKEVDYERFMKVPGTTERPSSFVVFDLETTGLSAQNDEIIEIGAIRFRFDEPVEVFHTYVKPKKMITKKITSITGITNEKVKDAPSIEEILPLFINFIKDDILIAHNSNFDMGFILQNLYNQGYKKIKNKSIDTLKLARQKVRVYDIVKEREVKLRSYKLETLKEAFELCSLGSHNALDDCKVCAYIYIKIRKEYGGTCLVDEYFL